MPPDAAAFRRNLLRWYDAHKRDLPWRRTGDPYRIWVSEIMLQQTRVSAVIPYFEAFLARFPQVEKLAEAREQELLRAWAGLGYYSRVRNMRKAARRIVELGNFPREYAALRELPGVGEYTAAAVSSIAFGLKRAAVDGNVARVLSRVLAEPGARSRIQALADKLIGRKRPGDFNQAMMELGATICLPACPQCLLCPIGRHCAARSSGTQSEFPVKPSKARRVEVEDRLLVIERKGRLLLWQRPPDSRRMPGFWELPRAEQIPEARVGAVAGWFPHTIVNTRYRFEVARASISRRGTEFRWVERGKLNELPLSTTTKKALACLSE